MKRKIYKEKGITLVALVITIIILLILTGVTLNTALSDNGLFQKAKFAGEKYKESEKQEQSALEDIEKEMDKISIDYNEYVGCSIDYKPEKSTCKISKETSGVEETEYNKNGIDSEGNQTFTSEDLEWKIWDYDKYTKTVRLISSKPTTQTLTLKGASGYNNGVWAMNEICRQCYGKNGENGITVSNLKNSDIAKVSTYDYTKYSHDGDFNDKPNGDGTIKFGSAKTYTTNNYYPEMWIKYDSKWTYKNDGTSITGEDKECLLWERENGYKTQSGSKQGTNITEFKQAYYSHTYTKEEFINEKYCDLIFKGVDSDNSTPVWLSTRCLALTTNEGVFGFLAMWINRQIMGSGCFWSNETTKDKNYRLRPMVSINLTTSNYMLEKEEDSSNEEVRFKLIQKEN